MKTLIESNGKQIEAYVYDSMFDYVKDAADCTINVAVNCIHGLSDKIQRKG